MAKKLQLLSVGRAQYTTLPPGTKYKLAPSWLILTYADGDVDNIPAHMVQAIREVSDAGEGTEG